MSSLLSLGQKSKVSCSIHACSYAVHFPAGCSPCKHWHQGGTGYYHRPPAFPILEQQVMVACFPFIQSKRALPAEEQLQQIIAYSTAVLAVLFTALAPINPEGCDGHCIITDFPMGFLFNSVSAMDHVVPWLADVSGGHSNNSVVTAVMCCQNNKVLWEEFSWPVATPLPSAWCGGAKKEKLDPEDWARGMGPIGKDLEGGKRVWQREEGFEWGGRNKVPTADVSWKKAAFELGQDEKLRMAEA